MAVTINGTSGINTPGVVNTAAESIATTLTVTGAATAASLQVGGVATNVYPLVSGTAVASTSGTSIDFTSIPSWVKRITVMLQGVSTSGTSVTQLQLGAGSVTTSGYVSSWTVGTTVYSQTTGFGAQSFVSAADTKNGSFVLTKITGNTWVSTALISNGGTTVALGTGSIALGGTLDRVRITTVNGTDTFDAGSINILYE
jgi:hypothetical protein